VGERFGEASLKGLDFLVISDHDDLRAQADPDFGSFGVIAVPAYEASLSGGHAQMLGATRAYDEGAGDVASTNALADALRGDGGIFQANHPSYRAEADFERCEQADAANWEADPLHWKYGYSVAPDSIEVWNTTTLIQPAQLYYECWLQRGARIGITGGSDSHGANQANLAVPTTWALADRPDSAAIVDAIRSGRTTVSRTPPALGGARLLLEADRDRDGSFESGIGNTVPPGTPMRVRADGLAGPGFVRVRANGRTLVDGATLTPGGEVSFLAPSEAGWSYALLYLVDGTQAVDPGCRPIGQPISTCSADLAIAGMTSPVWTGTAPLPALDMGSDAVRPAEVGREPDSQAPLPPGRQSGHGRDLPVVPLHGTPLRTLRVRGRRGRLTARWSGGGPRYRVERRRGAGRWQVVRRGTRLLALAMHARHGRWRVRVRSQPATGVPGAWSTASARVPRFARAGRG
jgi:hypothetical protein